MQALFLITSGTAITVFLCLSTSIFSATSGRQRAEDTLERHTILADLLMRIGVRKETALADACKVEHDLSEESFEAIKRALYLR